MVKGLIPYKKKSQPKSSYPASKNTCQIFEPKKIPESKISNPKKSFEHTRHLKSQAPLPSPPPPPWGSDWVILEYKTSILAYKTMKAKKKHIIILINNILTSNVQSLWGNLKPWPCCLDLAIAQSILTARSQFEMF